MSSHSISASEKQVLIAGESKKGESESRLPVVGEILALSTIGLIVFTILLTVFRRLMTIEVSSD